MVLILDKQLRYNLQLGFFVKKGISIICLLVGLTVLHSQSIFPENYGKVNFQEQIVETLIAEGFQSVNLAVSDNTLIVSYENRVYRLEATALKQVAKLVIAKIEKQVRLDTLVLISKQLQIPIITTKLLIKNIDLDQLDNTSAFIFQSLSLIHI